MKSGQGASGAGLEPRERKQTNARPCPICQRPALESFRPFCSKRCADVDLARWLNGRYAIPGEPIAEEDKVDDGEAD